MISKEEPIPNIDYKMQHPEGMEVAKRLSIFEEYVAGYLHRLPVLKNIPLHRFLEYFSWYFSALSIFAVYLLSSLFTKSRRLSLLSALYYAVAYPAIIRTVDGLFLREILALPFMIFHLYLFLKSMESKKMAYPIISGALLIIIFASWKLSQFYFLLFIGFLIIKYLLSRNTDGFKKPFLIFTICQTTALMLCATLVPYLKNRSFILSLPILLNAGLLIILVIDKYKPLKMALKISLFSGLIIAGILFLSQNKSYSHVYSVFLYKMKYSVFSNMYQGKPPP